MKNYDQNINYKNSNCCLSSAMWINKKINLKLNLILILVLAQNMGVQMRQILFLEL